VNTSVGGKIPKGLAAAALLLLTACGTTSTEPTQGELRNVWESRNIPPANYKSDILAFMRTYLNDPRNVRDTAVSPPALKRLPGDPGDRFVSCLRYNAKKSDGRYAGSKTGIVVYTLGKLDRFIETPQPVKAVCEGVALEPFPELQKLTR
jgi:hypothetical protein